MKTLFINAAGTANGYFLAETAKRFRKSRINLLVGDMNPPHLVAASKFADTFVKTPPIRSRGFRSTMVNIFGQHNVGFYIPVFPEDCVKFPFREGEKPLCLSVPARSVSLFKNKFLQRVKLKEAEIGVEDFFKTSVQAQESGLKKGEIIAKPLQGSGSKGIFDCTLSPILQNEDELFFVSKCGGIERTVDVLNWEGHCWTVTRERIEVKSGICSKTRAYFCPTHDNLARRLCSQFHMPLVFCFQTMTNIAGKTVITDLNPRIGAGCSMSRFAGIDFAYNLIGLSLGIIDKPKVSKVSETTVVRVWRDLAMP